MVSPRVVPLRAREPHTEWRRSPGASRGGAVSDLVRVPYVDARGSPCRPGWTPPRWRASPTTFPTAGGPSWGRSSEARPAAPVLVVGGAGDVALYAVAAGVAARFIAGRLRGYRCAPVGRGRTGRRHAVERPVDGSRLGRYPITVDHSGDVAGLHKRAAIDRARRLVHFNRDLLRAGDRAPLLEMYTRGSSSEPDV